LVDEHVLTTLPVGSSVLAKHYFPGISSATIRNELLGLENLGLAFSPHTSAGRIPTNQGYRYFVNQLLLNPLALLAANSVFELSAVIDAYDMSSESALSAQALETSLASGQTSMRQALELLSKSTGLLSLCWSSDDSIGLHVRGLSRLLTQPEFSESTRLLPLMALIEEQDDLIHMMESGMRTSDLSILIGLEPTGMLANYTLLLRRGADRSAIFGLLGPTRMEYRKALAALESVAQYDFGHTRI
jgi:heat-inducible transcriptional repressor